MMLGGLGLVNSGEEFDVKVETMRQDLERAKNTWMVFILVIGRKPSN